MSDSQAQIDQIAILNSLVTSLAQLIGPHGPAIIPGALYARPQMERNLGTGNTTTTLWMDHGLKVYRPGTKSDLFLGDDIISFVRAHPELKHAKDYQSKIEQRKKGRSK